MRRYIRYTVTTADSDACNSLAGITGYQDLDVTLVQQVNRYYRFYAGSVQPPGLTVVVPDDIVLPAPGRWLREGPPGNSLIDPGKPAALACPPSNGGTSSTIATRAYAYTDFLEGASFGVFFLSPYELAVLGSATITLLNSSEPEHPGVAQMSVTTDPGRASISFRPTFGPDNTQPLRYRAGQTSELVFRTPSAFVDMTDFVFFFGVYAPFGFVPDDGYYMFCSGSGDIFGECSNGGLRTTSPSVATLSPSTWYYLKITTTDTTVVFEVFDMSGTLLGTRTVNSNLPVVARMTQGSQAWIDANSGAWTGPAWDALGWNSILQRGSTTP